MIQTVSCSILSTCSVGFKRPLFLWLFFYVIFISKHGLLAQQAGAEVVSKETGH